MTSTPQGTKDQSKASYLWYPFLKYQEECQASGKEATIDGWMRSTGKLKEKIDFENRKAAAAEQSAKEQSEKKAPKKEPTA